MSRFCVLNYVVKLSKLKISKHENLMMRLNIELRSLIVTDQLNYVVKFGIKKLNFVLTIHI